MKIRRPLTRLCAGLRPFGAPGNYTNSPEVVSSDFVGSRHAGVVDSLATIVQGNRCVLYVWYDNEFGYSCQVMRIVQRLADVELPRLPH